MADSKKYNGSTWEHSLRKLETATDTITTLPADLYADGTNATVGLQGNMSQTGTPTPTTPITPSETGERTGNLLFKKIPNANIGNDGKISGYSSEYEFALYVAEVEEGKTYTTGVSFAQVYALYTSEPDVGSVSYNGTRSVISSGVQSITIPTGNSIKYIVLRWASTIEQTMFNEGSTPLPYEPYGYKLDIKSASTTTPVYLGEVESTRRIKKSTVSITNIITLSNGNKAGIFAFSDSSEYAIQQYGLCDIAEYDIARRTTGMFYVNRQDAIFIGDSNDTLDTLKATYDGCNLWYVLENPTTGIVNEPLRKIGDYADTVSGITIPTIAGANTLSVGTTLQPSEVSVNYKGWHPVSDVHGAEVGNNLFDYTTMATSAENSYLNPDGTIGASNDWNISDYIPCDGTSFTVGNIGGNTPAICLYDESKQYITGESYNTGGANYKRSVSIMSQSTAKYIRFSYNRSSGAAYDDLSAIMLNKGSSLLPYEPYGTHWT